MAAARALTPYENVVRRLYQVNLYNAVKMGLENITALHQATGKPLDKLPNIVHVAGTNGKGSVAYKIARALQYSGVQTGLFVSPHIATFRERMQVNGEYISEEEVVELLPVVFDACEKNHIPATFFELTTAVSFLHFARKRCQSVVMEVGLGGRLDATNIVNPCLSIITSIGLEHTRILGDTIEKIAMEKAGVIKPGIPVVIGNNTPRELLQRVARERSAPVLLVPEHQMADFEDENTAIARTALDYLRSSLPLSNDGVDRGLRARPPCRFEVMEYKASNNRRIKVVLDVGHNPPAIERLFERAQRVLPNSSKLRLVVGLSYDKDLSSCLSMMLKHVPPHRLHFVQAPHPRAATAQQLQEEAKRYGAKVPDRNCSYASVREGVGAALKEAEEDEVVVVCGTFFIMGEARQALGCDEPMDSDVIAEVAGAHFRASQEMFSEIKAPATAP